MQAKTLLPLLFGTALALLGSGANAGATWNLANPGTAGAKCSGTGASFSCAGTADAPGDLTATATATAWAVSNSAPSTDKFGAATLMNQSGNGFGLAYSGESTTSPQHAIDNSTRTELVSFYFGAANQVALTSITQGWAENDRDFSILRCISNCDPNAAGKALSNWTVAGLTTAAGGWELVTSVNFTGVTSLNNDTNTQFTFNSANVTSSWWLVSAFNAGYGSAGDTNKDYFKLLKVAGNVYNPPPPPGVPEPGSMALLGIGLLGLLRASRKNKQ